MAEQSELTILFQEYLSCRCGANRPAAEHSRVLRAAKNIEDGLKLFKCSRKLSSVVLRFQVFCKRFAPDDQIREGNVAQCTADMQRCRQSDQYCRVCPNLQLVKHVKS